MNVVEAKRVHLSADPFSQPDEHKNWREQGNWPCRWIAAPGMDEAPFVGAFRLKFTLPSTTTLRLHVTADERYEFYVDGQRIGRGPEKGDPFNWFFESFELTLSVGEHLFVAHVWALGEHAPLSQMSVQTGFLLAADAPHTELVGTGLASWEAKTLGGYSFVRHPEANLRESMPDIDGRLFAWGFEHGEGEGWVRAEARAFGMGKHIDWDYYKRHWLKPATLPAMLEEPQQRGMVRHLHEVETLEVQALAVRADEHLSAESEGWQALIGGQGTVTVPADSGRRLIIDLENYVCAYPELLVSGGTEAAVRIHWAESLRAEPKPFHFDKGYRNEIEGKYFVGFGSTFTLDGGSERRYEPLWWQAGRYLELTVITQAEPLTIKQLVLHETRYPLSMESRFETNDPRYNELLTLLQRGITASAHETFEDSPYFEQMQYTADSRLESLCIYVMSRDARLPRKSIGLFNSSRLASGLTQARYPCRHSQIIPGFALWWLGMVHDYAHWRDDLPFVQRLMPGMRATAEAYLRYLGDDGLVRGLEGWNTLDWVPAWEAGVPPDGLWGASGLNNWQYVYALSLVADLEAQLGEDTLAGYYRDLAARHAGRSLAFWDNARGLLADNLDKTLFSEHTQCMALLSGQLPADKAQRAAENLVSDPELARTTIYFSHYLLETYAKFGYMRAFQTRLEQWFGLLGQGLKAPPETDALSRSDCHGWSSHPLYHVFASVLGVRPGSLGFRSVVIRPQLGSLTRAAGTLVHPKGFIRVAFERQGETLTGEVNLPAGVNATLELTHKTLAIEGDYAF